MTLEPLSLDLIKVGYISQTEGYIEGLSIAEANDHEKNNPQTTYIFINGDKKVTYLTIDDVNALTTNDLLRSDPCPTGPQPCGPPKLEFFGGGGIGAEANPVVDDNGVIIAVDLIRGGFGYTTPPKVQVIDPCEGSGAVLTTEIRNGSVVRVIVNDGGGKYRPPKSSVPQYPAIIKLTEVIVKTQGINYNCGVDKIVVEPANGAVLEYDCESFGRIRSIKVLRSGNFTSLPRITMQSDTGFNASFTPVFEVERDPLPVQPIATDIVQVFDLVGLNINGFVGGKEYYGNVYFVDGVKFAGTSANAGTNIRVFETREASISGESVPVARVVRTDADIETQVAAPQQITAEPDVSEVVIPPTTAPSSTPTSTPTSTPSTPTPSSTPSPAPSPPSYTPPPDTGGSGGYGGY